MRLTFDPGEAAQVDFGAGPELVDPATGALRRTWAFVMTLAFSRHQYVEFVWDQSVRTWLGCHQRAFDWFGAEPARLIIDDFGLKPLRAPADEDLHDLIAERYEQSATVVSSNLDFTEWDQAFPGNRLLASATIDRLRHNAYCLTLDGASYRAPRQGPNKAKTALASTPKNNQP